MLLFLGPLRSGSTYLVSGAVTVDLTAMGMEKVEVEGEAEEEGEGLFHESGSSSLVLDSVIGDSCEFH